MLRRDFSRKIETEQFGKEIALDYEEQDNLLILTVRDNIDGQAPVAYLEDCQVRALQQALSEYLALPQYESEELLRLRQWVEDLQSGQWINCVYCGHRYGPVDTTPVSKAKQLQDHIETCPDHPMSALIKENRELQRTIERIRMETDYAGNNKR